MNGFEALTRFAGWDGTAKDLVPRLEALDEALSAMLGSFQVETDKQKKKRGASVLAPIIARSNVRQALERTRAGNAPPTLAVTRLVAEAGAALFWGLAIDARHGAALREKGHRQSEDKRNKQWARRADSLKAAGCRTPVRTLHGELADEKGKPTYQTVRAGVRKGRDLLKS